MYNLVISYKVYKNEIEAYSKGTYDIYDGWCNNIKSQYTSYGIFNHQDTCKNVMYYLNFITEQYESIYNYYRCKYLYYWIHHDLLEKKKIYYDSSKLYRSFMDVYSENVGDYHICNNYVDDSKINILEKSAKLTELYDTFNNNSQDFNCTCAKKCSELYTKYVEQCDNNNDHDYCSELQNFKYKYDDKMKSIDRCEGAHKILPSAIKDELHVIIIIPMIIVTVLSFLVFALYKFTPIGSRITHRKRKKHVFFDNQSYRTNTTLPNSGKTRRKEQNIVYNIAYNTTKYS